MSENVKKLDNNDFKLIRKLGLSESLLDFEAQKGSMNLTVAVHVELKEAYTIDLKLLNKACSYWVKKYILLQATILRESLLKIKNNKKYFAYMKKDVFEFKNVELIETNDESKFKEIVELDLKQKLDLINGPLWTLKVIKLNQNNSNKYTFVFTCHHSIGDGKNMVIIIHLLNIIGALLTNETCEEMNGEIVDTPKDIEKMVDELYVSKNNIPQVNEKVVYDSKNRTPPDLGNPIDGVHGRVECLSFESEKLKKLMATMKQKTNGCKLTGVLETAFCLAMKQTLLDRNLNEFASLPYQYLSAASLRDKLGLPNTQMGVYSVGLDTILDTKDLELGPSFWQLSERQSKTLHKRLQNGEDLLHLIDGYDITNDLENDVEVTLYNFTHSLSNIGQTINTSSPIIKANQFYFFMPMLEKRFIGLLFNGIATINGNLNWSISYNEKFYATDFILELKNNLKVIIESLISDD